MHDSAFQYADPEQRRASAQLGMWIFLMTEVMLFGGLFAAYYSYRYLYPAGFAAAAGHADFWLGTANTAVLLISSLTMALAVHAAQAGERRRLIVCLLLTVALGTLFLGFKGLEYFHHFHENLFPGPNFRFTPEAQAQGAEMFFYLYFTMTGLHALHMLIGLGLLIFLIVQGGRGKISAANHTAVEVAGLYWHFVDVMWIFLFPMFYLAKGH